MSWAPDNTDWLICTACGTQFPTADRRKQTTCFICDDPRQFTPPTGQAFTTLGEMLSSSAGYQNVFETYEKDDRITFIHTTPKFAIGQRAALLRLPSGCGGNILWDCLALLDAATVARIRALGGLAAIAISHPHYYTTHLLWARTFGCPVYLAAEDRGWLAQADGLLQRFLEPGRTELRIDPEPPASPAPPPPPSPSLPSQGDDIDADPAASSSSSSVLLLKPGGHFPGSLVLLFDGHLLVADTLVTTPAGLGSWATDATGAPRRTGQPAAEPAAAAPVPAASDGGGGRTRPAGMNSFAFMWSIPNMIPLPPADLARMWDVLRRHDFTSTHGAFMGQDIEHVDVKRRVLQSMKIQVMGMGWTEHPFLSVDT